MTKHRIEAHRADGVLMVNLGSQQYVLINLAESLTTMAIDGSVVDRYGPWTNFDTVRPESGVYAQVDRILDRPGNLVSADDIGPKDYEPQPLADFVPDRKTLASMLKSAGLLGELTDTKNLQHDPDFLMRCMTTIVPQMSAAGVVVGDPATFCSMLHMERTGLIPKAGDMPVMQETPAAEAAEMSYSNVEPDTNLALSEEEEAEPILGDNVVENVVDANAVAQIVDTPAIQAPQAVTAAAPQAPPMAPVAPAQAPMVAAPMPMAPAAQAGVPALPAVKPIGKLFKHTKVAARKQGSVGKPGVA